MQPEPATLPPFPAPEPSHTPPPFPEPLEFPKCSDCKAPLPDDVVDESEPLCSICWTDDLEAVPVVLRDSRRQSSGPRPFGLGFYEIPSSAIVQSLNTDPPGSGIGAAVAALGFISLIVAGVVRAVGHFRG